MAMAKGGSGGRNAETYALLMDRKMSHVTAYDTGNPNSSALHP